MRFTWVMIGLDHFGGFKNWNFNIFRGYQENKYFWGVDEIEIVDFLFFLFILIDLFFYWGDHYKTELFSGSFIYISGFFKSSSELEYFGGLLNFKCFGVYA